MAEDKISACRKKNYPTSIEGISKFYDEWAPTIDEDVSREGYTGPEGTAAALAKVLPDRDTDVMDMACGTGLVAHHLKKLGFKNIDGVDISKASLKISEEKGFYRRLICDSIGTNKLDVKDNTYDGLVCSGALALGHLNQECFPEWIRIVKTGGHIIFNVIGETMNTYEKFKDGKLDADIQELADKGLWEMVSYEMVENLIFKEPGGYIIFNVSDATMNTYDKFKDGKLDADIQELADKGLWEMVSYEMVENLIFKQPGHLYVFKVS